jgi:undecaprenyl-diphosphatase
MLTLILQAIILGIVQGATEFIPISSSAHLILVPWFFGWNEPALTSLTFDVALHIGTLLAVLVYFFKDWVRYIRAGIASLLERKIGADVDRRLFWLIVIGTIPGGIAGMVFESKIDTLFHTPGQPISSLALMVMALIIAILGSVLYLAEVMARHERPLAKLSLGDTIWIGLSQALAIFPGVSRSGATITTGLALGLQRESAARFSFLLSAPIIAGAGLKSLWEVFKGLQSGAISQSELLLFPVGMLMAAVSGFLCIRFLLKFLQRNSTRLFVFYRWGLAILVGLVVLIRG